MIKEYGKRLSVIITAFLLLLIFVSGAACGEEKTFTVTFDANGGTLYSGETVQIVSSASELNPPVFKREGYVFNGWDKDITAITDTATVKAQWIDDDDEHVYTVNFVLTCEVEGHTVKCLYNGEDYIQPVTVAEGQTLGESLVTPVAVNGETRDYSFVGWFYEDTEITADTVFSDEIFDGMSVTLTVRCKLDAIWTKPY